MFLSLHVSLPNGNVIFFSIDFVNLTKGLQQLRLQTQHILHDTQSRDNNSSLKTQELIALNINFAIRLYNTFRENEFKIQQRFYKHKL